MRRASERGHSGGAWAVVPAKNFSSAKSRLAPALTPRERALLARSMLTHVLEVLGACPELSGVCVATDSSTVAALARHHGARVILDAGEPGLGSVVERAILTLADCQATAALVVMADLPELGLSDVSALFERSLERDVVIAPDRHGEQTNGLLLPLARPMPTYFGRPRSLAAHEAAARARGLSVAVYQSSSFGLDLDDSADLDHWRTEFPRGGGAAEHALVLPASTTAPGIGAWKG